jgi:hypothetical protein
MLLLFAMAKIGTVISEWFGLLPHAELGAQFWMFTIGVAEIFCIWLMLFVLPVKRSYQLISVLGISFLIYRLVINPTQCPCMGAAPNLLPWLKVNAQFILMTIPFWWLCLGLWGWAREITLGKANPICA